MEVFMFKFSIYPGRDYSFEEQIEICRELGFNNLELCEWCKENMFYEINETRFRNHVIKNKIYIPMLDMEQSIDKVNSSYLKELIRKCGILGIEYLNIGDIRSLENTYEIFKEILDYSALCNVKLCVENKYMGYFNEIGNLNEFFKSSNSTFFLVFNPLEFVKSKQHPFLNIFYNGKFKNSINFLRITDGLFSGSLPKLPGEGNGEIKELISATCCRNYKGYISIVPYFDNRSYSDCNKIFESLESIILSL